MTGSTTGSLADSHTTRASLRTLDKERIRQKALYLNMKEKLRMSICVRIQKVCKKPPQAAQALSDRILNHLQSEGMSSNVTDTELSDLVAIFSAEKFKKETLQPATSESTPLRKTPQEGKKSKPSSRSKESRQKPTTIIEDEPTYLTEAQAQQRSIGFVLPPKKSPKKHKQGDIWNELVQYQTLQAQKSQIRSEWSSVLSAQVAEKEIRRREHDVTDGKYFAESMIALEKMNQAEQEKEKIRIQRAKEQNMIQEEQRQFKLKKKQAELDARREAEARMADTIARQKKDEEAKEIARREAEKLKMAQVLRENAEQLEKKKQIKANERELELKLADDYVKMEEMKEAMRQKSLEEMSKRIQAKMQYFDDTSKAEMDMKNKEDELRILRYQADYEKKQMELDHKKKSDAIERNRSQQEYLKNQMKIKQEKDRQEKEEYNKQAELWKEEREINERKDKLIRQQQACKNQLQQNWLKKQIQAKEENALEADHTPLEIQLNKKILHKVQELKQDENIIPTIANKTRQRSRELHAREKKINDARLKPASRK